MNAILTRIVLPLELVKLRSNALKFNLFWCRHIEDFSKSTDIASQPEFSSRVFVSQVMTIEVDMVSTIAGRNAPHLIFLVEMLVDFLFAPKSWLILSLNHIVFCDVSDTFFKRLMFAILMEIRQPFHDQESQLVKLFLVDLVSSVG